MLLYCHVLQATIKDGTADDKLVLSLKLTAPARGAAKCLATLIAAEAAGQGSAGVDSLGNAAVLGGLSSGLESGAGLMHDKVSTADALSVGLPCSW